MKRSSSVILIYVEIHMDTTAKNRNRNVRYCKKTEGTSDRLQSVKCISVLNFFFFFFWTACKIFPLPPRSPRSEMLLQFFLVILTVVLGQVLPSCYVDLPDKGVTYDLNAFEGLAVEVSDNRGEGNDPWYYKVYVCSNSPPNDLPDPSCKTTTNDDGTPDPLSGKPGPAFQYGPGQGFCKRLGNDVSTATIAPLFSGSSNRDNRGYARGVLLNYTGGNMCWSNTQNAYVPRQVTLIMECHDGPIVPPGSTLVLESTSCQYFVSIKSRMGCPVQCLGAGGTVCGTNGVCGYDATNGSFISSPLSPLSVSFPPFFLYAHFFFYAHLQPLKVTQGATAMRALVEGTAQF